MNLQSATALGPCLRSLRRSAGLTQEELAERAGISARTVSDVEREIRGVIHGGTALRLAGALGLSGQELQAFRALARGRAAALSRDPEPGGLPGTPTPILGRSAELATVTGILREAGTRLLTLTGPGGIDKTRLAIEAARQVRESFDSVVFVSLGEVREASLVAPELAKALGVAERQADLQSLLIGRLADERALVVLDTFEHLTAAAPLVYAMTLRCAGAVFLVTSRSALRLRGERQFPVPPLGVPDEPQQVSVEQLSRWPATALFWDRARAVRPDLAADASAGRYVAEICRKLDGLPLAIELAAARVKHLPLPAIGDQLDDRLRLLVGGPLDLPARQRAIRDTIAWSHDLLEPAQERLFRRLAAFRGGWDLQAAEAVCGQADDVGDVLDGVSALVDQSLVILDPTASWPRYRLPDVVREYAAHRLAQSGEASQVGRRQALYFLRLAEQAGPSLTQSGHQQWFRRLEADRGNLRQALEWSIVNGETELAYRFTIALWRYWRQLGDFTEGRRWIEAVLALPGAVQPALRAEAVGAAAALTFPQGDHVRLEALADEAMTLAERGGDPLRLRNALTLTGFVATGQGRHQDAVAIFDRCVALCRPLGDSWQLATSYLNRGVALLRLDRPAAADADFAAGLRIYRQLGDEIFTARAVNQRAQAALAQGDFDQAGVLARDSLTAFAEHGERQGIATALGTLGAVAAALGDVDRAATLAGAEMAIMTTLASSQLPDRVMTSRLLTVAEESADQVRWRHCRDVGSHLATDAAIAYALSADIRPERDNRPDSTGAG